MKLQLKRIAILVAILCVSTAFAADKPKKAAVEKPPVLAPVTEITAAVQGVQDIVKKCAGEFSGSKIVAELEVTFAEDLARMKAGYPVGSKRPAPSIPELEEAHQGVLKVYDTLRACKMDGGEKIKESSKFILIELGKRKLRELGADYLVQSQTALEAIGDDPLFSTENSKLKALLSRIDLELSAQ
jgi:hypothetical protein